MKIHYVAHSAIPSRTANAVHVMKMCAAFARNGHAVRLFVPDRASQAVSPDQLHELYGVDATFGIERVPWTGGPFRFRRFGFRAGRLAADGADLVYSRSLLPALSAMWSGALVVYECHDPPKAALDRLAFGLLSRHRKLRRIVFISQALRRAMEERWPRMADRVVVAHDGADVSKADGGPRSSDRLRVCYTGHLYAGRGIDLMIELARRCPWADFDLFGGEDADVSSWRKRSSDVSNVRFHGYIPPSQVPSRLAASDVLLAPYETRVAIAGNSGDTGGWMSPLKVFEYMAAGRAIICSDLPSLREVLSDGDTALLRPPAAVEAWERALQELRDAGTRSRLGLNARRTLETEYTWQARARRILEGI